MLLTFRYRQTVTQTVRVEKFHSFKAVHDRESISTHPILGSITRVRLVRTVSCT